MSHTDCVSESRESVTTKRVPRVRTDLQTSLGIRADLITEKLYSYVQAVNVKDAKGLQTVVVEE